VELASDEIQSKITLLESHHKCCTCFIFFLWCSKSHITCFQRQIYFLFRWEILLNFNF